MAVLKFKTPDSMHCSWEEPPCLAYDRDGYCKFFDEFLRFDGESHIRCAQCMNLGEYGSATKGVII